MKITKKKRDMQSKYNKAGINKVTYDLLFSDKKDIGKWFL